MEAAIAVKQLGKQYRLRHSADGATMVRGYQRLSEAFGQFLRRAFRTKGGNTFEQFHALRDISFRIAPGEVVGIIGRNGAGKSTLLKILSRITPPSSGRIEINGRVVSLLEVGTGFHPELTGRENIFLNGAILGMSKVEIHRKFAEIVDFAEVEKFLDTPVKHYSSGMYVRLAFSVAAHLEPEVLVIDEVLAVGDAAFQNKCLNKMRDVATSGRRTILFVSHNMSTVAALCSRCILLRAGQLVADGSPAAIIQQYFEHGASLVAVVELSDKKRRYPTRGKARFASVQLIAGRTAGPWQIGFGNSISIQFSVATAEVLRSLSLGVALSTMSGLELTSSRTPPGVFPSIGASGSFDVIITFDALRLVPGLYRVSCDLKSERGLEDYVDDAAELEIVLSDEAVRLEVATFKGVFVPATRFQYSPRSS